MKKGNFPLVIAFFLVILLFQKSFSQEKVTFGFWVQLWYQYVENGKHGATGLNDFVARRAYLSISGKPSNFFSFFAHIAGDRIGQEGLDNPALGLGSGLAFRDLWIALNFHDNLKIQIGRMYVPLTRNYGVTSTKSLLTTDLSFLQGGVRGNIFYTSKVGRDDGIVLWGTPLEGFFQYRLMVSEGIEGEGNPNDNLRFVGRAAVNLLEPEKGWFNKGTYLGEKKILSLGAAFDTQSSLSLNSRAQQDNFVWTADVFFDHPLGAGALTAEAAYIHIRNSAQAHNVTELEAGDNANLFYLQGGYLLPSPLRPGRLQPYLRYETARVEQKSDTNFWTGGFNYYVNGHDSKISLDYTQVEHESSKASQGIFTLQITAGL